MFSEGLGHPGNPYGVPTPWLLGVMGVHDCTSTFIPDFNRSRGMAKPIPACRLTPVTMATRLAIEVVIFQA